MTTPTASPTSLRILSIAILGKHGNPLLLRSYSPPSDHTAFQHRHRHQHHDLKWQYAAHTSLDFFEERESPAAKTVDCYLGLLYTMEDYAVYGYQTNTRVKFVLILAMADAVVRDIDVKTIFRAIHNTYIAYLSNPFNPCETENFNQLAPPIQSRKFKTTIDLIAGQGQEHAESEAAAR
ncbi:BQ5605_C016g08090 [Microbotryum silenes-dioicae]|uniref:Trafficking protein particle complex subunit 2-like protein n=1 Tax=Microbotryum silenes-dioicae TaxID=796604 RepID=A0A2X0NYT1_9BASI|nr:BQ5605_C016g08090 [Microbotryum silenes-dioicae]